MIAADSAGLPVAAVDVVYVAAVAADVADDAAAVVVMCRLTQPGVSIELPGPVLDAERRDPLSEVVPNLRLLDEGLSLVVGQELPVQVALVLQGGGLAPLLGHLLAVSDAAS